MTVALGAVPKFFNHPRREWWLYLASPATGEFSLALNYRFANFQGDLFCFPRNESGGYTGGAIARNHPSTVSESSEKLQILWAAELGTHFGDREDGDAATAKHSMCRLM